MRENLRRNGSASTLCRRSAPVGTRAMPIGRNGGAERTQEVLFEKYRMRRITPQRYYFISVLPTFFGALFHLSQREKSMPHRHLPPAQQKGGTRSCECPSKTNQLFVKNSPSLHPTARRVQKSVRRWNFPWLCRSQKPHISPHSGVSCRRHHENKRKKFATSKIMRNFVAK